MRIVNTRTIDEDGNEIWEETQEEDAPIIERSPEELEAERIRAIKTKAGEIINSKYSIYWQLNHPRVDVAFAKEYEWIDAVRAMSNDLEADSTKTPEDFIIGEI